MNPNVLAQHLESSLYFIKFAEGHAIIFQNGSPHIRAPFYTNLAMFGAEQLTSQNLRVSCARLSFVSLGQRRMMGSQKKRRASTWIGLYARSFKGLLGGTQKSVARWILVYIHTYGWLSKLWSLFGVP